MVARAGHRRTGHSYSKFVIAPDLRMSEDADVIFGLATLCFVLVLCVGALWMRLRGLNREVERLLRLTAQRAAELERLRRSDASVVERLPDPLLVLDSE